MSKKKQHSKQFKLDAILYRKQHPDLSQNSDFSNRLHNILDEHLTRNVQMPSDVWTSLIFGLMTALSI